MTLPIELTEYERRAVPLSQRAASDLIAASDGRVSVVPTSEPGTHEIQASHHVGTVVTDEVRLLIRPKVSIDNLLIMLGASVEHVAWWRSHFDYERSEDLLVAFLAFFARTVESALQGGVFRSYRDERDRPNALRGRIDFPELLRQPSRPFPLPCAFAEFTADIPLNRYLKAAVRRGRAFRGVTRSTQRLLAAELTKLDEVADVEPRFDALDEHVFTRLDRHYQPATDLARLVLSRGGLTDLPGGATSSSFLVDMNKVFERFIAAELRTHLDRELLVEIEPRHHLDADRVVGMYPDIVIRRGREIVYVADAKYKLNEAGPARNSDYYQLLAYTTAMDLPDGLLVYCQESGLTPPHELRVRNTSKALRTIQVRLSGSPEDVELEMKQLAAAIERYVFRGSSTTS